MARDLFEEAGIAGNAGEGRDLFAEAGIAPPASPPDKSGSIAGSIADFGLDFGKRIAGSVVQGLASIPLGIERGIKGAVQQSIQGGVSEVMPASVYQPGLDAEEAIYGPETSAQRAARGLAGARAASAIPGIPFSQSLSDAGKRGQDAINATATPQTQRAVEGSQVTGNLFKGQIDFGKDPSVRGYVMQAADVFGSMLPVIASALATKNPATGVAIGSAVGGSMAAGEAANSARDFMKKKTDAQLASESPFYATLIEGGASPQDARRMTLDKAANSAALLQGIVASFGDRFTGKLVTGQLDNLLTKTAGKSIAAKIAAGGIMSSAEEGVQEVGEGLAADYGIASAVPSKEIGEDSAANLVLGALGGGPVGAGSGARSGIRDRFALKDEPAPAPVPAPSPIVAQPINQPAPSQSVGTADTTQAATALREPVKLTALDRAAEIDTEVAPIKERLAELSAENGYGPTFDAERQDLATQVADLERERAGIAATWPKAVKGAPATFSTESGVKLDGEYALMDADDLVTSHTENLRPNALYPQELQPRDRSRDASEMQVSSIVQRLDPSRLGVSADVQTGAPIVGADGLVESGNARTIAMKRVYQNNGKQADDYKQWLRTTADQFGLSAQAVESMSKPVLVRVRTTPVNRAEFARQANASTVQRMSPSEQAMTDSNRLKSLDGLDPDEDGNFMNSHDFIRQFMTTLPITEQSELMESDGRLSTQGYRRVQNAVLAKAYGDSPSLRRMTESLDNNVVNLSKALVRVAPTIAGARERMAAGTMHQADIAPDLLAAVEGMSALKDKGWTVAQELGQGDLTGPKYSPEAAELMTFMSDNIRSPRRIAEFFQRYYEALEQAGDPSQPSMFGDDVPAPARADLLKRAQGAITNGNAAQDPGRGIAGEGAQASAQDGRKPEDAPGSGGRDQGNGPAGAVAAGGQQEQPQGQPASGGLTTTTGGREGYDTKVELDAKVLQSIIEKTRGEPLVNKPAKLEAWRNGTSKTDPAKFPIELSFTSDGRLDVNDGRHRIALAAERGEKVEAFIDGKDAAKAEEMVSSLSAQPASQPKPEKQPEASTGAVDAAKQAIQSGDAVTWMVNGARVSGVVVRAPGARGSTTVRATGGDGVKVGGVFNVPVGRLELDAGAVDATVASDVAGADALTDAQIAKKTIPEMTDAELVRMQAYYAPDHKHRAKIDKEIAARAGGAMPAPVVAPNPDPTEAPRPAPAPKPAPAPAPEEPSADDAAKIKAADDLRNALADLGDIFGKPFKASMMPEQEQKLVPVLTRVLDAAFRLGYMKFKDAAKFSLDQIRAALGAEVADALSLDHLQGSYIAMAGKYQGQGADTKRAVIEVEDKAEIESHVARGPEAISPATPAPAPAAEPETLSRVLLREINAGNMPRDNPALKKLVEAFDGKPADQARMKDAQEQLEVAIAMASRQIVARNEGDQSTFGILRRLYESQPNLNIRTSTSVANQAYSTPAPLAFLASRLAGITRSMVVHEPTAGTGMLLIGADQKRAVVNELNALRVRALREQGFAPTQKDAATQPLVPDGTQVDSVITNPPFGSVKGSDGKPVKVKVDGYDIGQIDHLIAARALATMKDDGRAVLILGANKVPGGLSTDDRIFFNWLYGHYNVTGHFELNGDLYARQGAGWPVRVIVIKGRQRSNTFSPVAGTIQRADNWDQVYEHYQQILGSSGKSVGQPGPGVGGSGAVETGARPVQNPVDPKNPVDDRPVSPGGGISAGNVAGTSPGVVPDSPKPAAKPVGAGVDEQRLNAQSSESGGLEPAGTLPATSPAGSAQPAGVNALSTEGNQFQVPYIARSARKDSGVLIPANMAQATQDALSRLEDEVGDIDAFARTELGYKTVADLHNALMGLQVDSVAMSIHQIKQGKAVVIADQTGIGKGRQAAAVIRWAAKQGYTPVFVSVKPSLFTDMFGDLADIGTNDVAPFIMNADAWVTGPDGGKLFANKPGMHKRAIERIANTGRLPDGSNALFMTYSQINVANVQRQALTALAPNAVFILDESHNAAGASATGDFMISALDMARGVTYLSATYAKRPDNMPLYFKTDIGDAAADTDGLELAMSSGGLPLQTVVSNNLVKAGQMFRRERSYDGVSIETMVDTKRRALHEDMSDKATLALRSIVAADRMFHTIYVKRLQEEISMNGSTVIDNAGNQAEAGVQHTEFSSVVHNFVKQMLLGLKAQTAADEAIAALKRGEKPVIAVENTMGSFLAEYAASNGIAQGGSLGRFDYRTVLSRALARTRVLTEKLPTGDEIKRPIPLSELDADTFEAYQQAQAVIDALDLDIPVSPIDWMRAEITRAGFSVAEITGRNLSVDYTDPKAPVLSALDLMEQRDKVNTTRLFNAGKLDALVLNVAGSTGISLHASERFEDQRQRYMIVAQAAGDINIFMQMLGRIHRTGQVVLPKYGILSVDLPTEKRPTAVLAVKMKSLNANTSSNTESATSVKSVDILNKYGDQVVNDYLNDNTRLAIELGVLDDIGVDHADDLTRKVTGRLALQPVQVQHAFYEEVEAQYNALIEYLNKTNQNDLEPRTFDYDAQETRQEVLFEGPNKNSPFGDDAIYGEYSIKAQGVPMMVEEIRATMMEHLNGATPKEFAKAMMDDMDSKYRKFYESQDEDGRRAAAFVRQVGQEFISSHLLGSTFRVDINGDVMNAGVMNIKNTHKAAGNPYSLSKIQLTIAVNGALRSLSVPATQFKKIEVSATSRYATVEELFKEQPPNQRETAKIITGNLLAAYGELQGVRGTIISFTKQDGTTEQGILLPKAFDYTKNTRGDYRLVNGELALKFLRESENKDIGRFGITSRDGVVRVLPYGQGVKIQVPKSKLKGARYFLDKALIAAAGEFVSSGQSMVANVGNPGEAVAALDLLMKKQALYALPSMADEARVITGGGDTRLSRAIQTDTPAFKRWFGDSKVVDAQGRPLVVYHGTQSDISSIDMKRTERLPGFWVTTDPDLANVYAAGGIVRPSRYPDGANVMPMYVRIERPYRFDPLKVGFQKAWDDYQSGEYDGFIEIGNDSAGRTTINVKTANQIKSATGNTGAFDPQNPDIRMSFAGVNASPLARGGVFTGGMPVTELQTLAARLKKAMPNMPDVNVLADPATAPKKLRDYIIEQGAWYDVEGAMHDGALYLFASGLVNAERAEHVLAEHEAAHYGLRAVLGEDGLKSAMRMIWLENARVRKAATQLQARGKLSDAAATEEVIVDIPTAELARLKGWRKLVSAARDFLARRGYTKLAEKLTSWLDGSIDAQQRADLFVAGLVRAARDYVAGRRRGAPTGYLGVTRLSGSLAEDLARQEKWLDGEARARGFKSVDDLVDRAYPVFENLAKVWRKKNPAGGGALSRGTKQSMTNRNVVGNQGGRSADDNSPGAGINKPMLVDPATLTFREKEQNRTAELAADTDQFDPIVVIGEGSKLSILDGHNRAAVARKRGDKLEAVRVTKTEYETLQEKGFDDGEIAWAALQRAGQSYAAGNLDSQFHGSGIANGGDKAWDELLSNESPAPISGGAQPSLSRADGAMRVKPNSATVVADFRNDAPLKRHPDYKAAKSGDVDAAARLVQDLVKPGSLELAREKFGDDVVFVPVHAEEASGRNKIPNALAMLYSQATGSAVDFDIVQANRAYHTGASAIGRLIARAQFYGEVKAGQRYVLVDDVTTMGSTLADLASYINVRGGVVVGSALLTDASRSGTMAPLPKTIKELEARHGTEIEKLFGIKPAALTWSESQYLIGFRTTDELRNKVFAARQARQSRLLAKGVSESQDLQGGTTRLSRAPSTVPVADRAEAIIQDKVAGATPLNSLTQAVTRASGIEKAAGMLYAKAGALLDSIIPDKIKAGVWSDYGVPEAVIDQRTMMQGHQRVQLRKAGALIEKLATLTRAESRVAYEWMNMDGEDPAAYVSMMQGLPEESVQVLQEVQTMIDNLSKEAVRMGQLSPEAYERNKFAYLRRSYKKYTDGLTAGEKRRNARTIAVMGEQYKGRGLVKSEAMAKIKNGAPDWWQRKMVDGKADTALKGQEFIRLERRAPSGERTTPLAGMDGKKEGKVLESIYWPVGEPIPAKYSEWTQEGTWEVRNVKGPNAVLWRDFTKDERERMGEIDEARFAIAKTLHAMIHDVEVGRYLEWLAHKQALKAEDDVPGVVVEPSERMRDTFAPNEWVLVPDSKISGTSVLRYGKLAGRYIPGPVWNDLRQITGTKFQPFGETYARVLRLWKTSKTALSPAVHTNNVMANFVMADWADVQAKHVAKSLQIMLAASGSKGGIVDRDAADEILTRYRDSGADAGSWATQEIAREQIDPLLEALKKEAESDGGPSIEAQTGVYAALQHALQMKFPEAFEAAKSGKAGKVVTKAGTAMIDLYQAEDEVFRLASWLRAKENGATDLQAGKLARKSFLDYNINAPWINAMRNSGWPFISFTYRAVPMLLEVAGKRPHKILKLMLIAGALEALGGAMAGGGGDDDERKLLPEEKAGRVWGMVPKLVRMPWNDAHGSPVYLDVRRWIPVGDVLDIGQGHSAVPILPSLVPGGPLVTVAEAVFNKSLFTGKAITLETDTAMQKTEKLADHLYKSFAPNILGLPNTYATEGVIGSMTGRTDAFGRELSTPQALASAFGVKVGSYPADVMRRNLTAAAMAQASEIDKNIGQLRRQMQTGRINGDEFEKRVMAEQEKKAELLRKLSDKVN